MKVFFLLLIPALLGPFSAQAGPPSEASAESLSSADKRAAKKRKRRTNPKKEAKDFEMLQRSATLYWEGVRWSDTDKAANFIEDSNDRMEFGQWLEAKLEGQRVMDAKIIRVDVKAVDDPKSLILRYAYITVAMQAYTMPEQVLKKETFEQKWYRNAEGWWLEWKSPTVAAREAAEAAEAAEK
jgi:hypothetical protein